MTCSAMFLYIVIDHPLGCFVLRDLVGTSEYDVNIFLALIGGDAFVVTNAGIDGLNNGYSLPPLPYGTYGKTYTAMEPPLLKNVGRLFEGLKISAYSQCEVGGPLRNTSMCGWRLEMNLGNEPHSTNQC